MGNDTEVFDLHQAAQELVDYLDDILVEEVDRDVILALTHNISEAYVALASKLDRAQVEVVD